MLRKLISIENVGKFIGNSTLHDPNGYIHFLKEGLIYRGKVDNGEPCNHTGSWIFNSLPTDSSIVTNQRTDYSTKEHIKFYSRWPAYDYLEGKYYGKWVHKQPNGEGMYETADELPVSFPLFIKPLREGDGKGIGIDSVVCKIQQGYRL